MLQKYRDRVEQGKTLWELLAEETSVPAEASLASLSTNESLMLLSELYTRTQESIVKGTKRQFWAFVIGITGYIIYLVGPFPRNLFVNGVLFALITYGYSFQSEQKRLFLRQTNILRLIPGLITASDRFVLGSLFELAVVLQKARLSGNDREMRIQLQILLSQLLALAPTDALQSLSQEQKVSLRMLTEQALDVCWGDPRYEPLAIAGLLALSSLNDRNLNTQAQDARVAHKSEQVRAAAEEYLEAIR